MARLTLEQLLALEWDTRTLATYEDLKGRGEVWGESGDAIAERYLRTCYEIDHHPRPIRPLIVAVDPFFEQRSRREPIALNQLIRRGTAEYHQGFDAFIMALLHPQQLPMSWRDIDSVLYQEGISAHQSTTQKRLNTLSDRGLLRKVCNPYRGGTYLYCHAAFSEAPQVGDRVIELMRRRGSRIGTVIRFRTYRDGNKYPVVNWEYLVRNQKPLACQFESFANPESLVVIERPNPITRRTAS